MSKCGWYHRQNSKQAPIKHKSDELPLQLLCSVCQPVKWLSQKDRFCYSCNVSICLIL